MPGLMSLRTLLATAGGVVLSVTGGLACGKVRSSLTCIRNNNKSPLAITSIPSVRTLLLNLSALLTEYNVRVYMLLLGRIAVLCT